MNGLNQKQKLLIQRVDEVLHYVWDPIRISGIPEARDEYSRYRDRVFSMLVKSSTKQEIVDYLDDSVTKQMGLKGNRNHDCEVAGILLNWKEQIFSVNS